MRLKGRSLNTLYMRIGKSVLVALLYLAGSFIGGFFRLNGGSTLLIAPQSGLALASVLLIGNSILPGIFAGSLLAAVLSGVSLPYALISSAGNLATAYFSAHFISQQKKFSLKLDNFQTIAALIFFGALVGPLISATASTVGMYSANITHINLLPQIWFMRWVRVALGVLIFTPVALIWVGNDPPFITFKDIFESAIIFAFIFYLEIIIFWGKLPCDILLPLAFLIVPLVVWGTIRNSLHLSSLINFFSALVFLWGVAYNQSALCPDESRHVLSFISVLATIHITSLIISYSMARLSATQKSLSFLSTHDSLTGLFNRLFFETEFKRLENSRQFPISIIMADIDDLKYVNDTFGHRSGDQLLINVSNLFSSIFRQEDIVSRYGGDEFVVLLPNTDSETAKKIVTRIRSQIAEYNRQHTDMPIRISMGVSTANHGESLQGHLKIADKRMYQEKQERHRE